MGCVERPNNFLPWVLRTGAFKSLAIFLTHCSDFLICVYLVCGVVICLHNLIRAVQTFPLNFGVRLSRNATLGELLVTLLEIKVFVWRKTAVKWFLLSRLLQMTYFAGQFPCKHGSCPHLVHFACVHACFHLVHASVLGSLFTTNRLLYCQ